MSHFKTLASVKTDELTPNDMIEIHVHEARCCWQL